MAADYRSAIAHYIAREARPEEKYGHQPRLYALTRRIGAGLEYDDDVVFAAAWLHDLGVFTGHRPEDPIALSRWDNVAYALEKVPAILAAVGFPAEKVPAVLEAIRTHQPGYDPVTPEATILRDADMLEQLGAIGVLRTICKVGRDTRYSTFTPAVAALRSALADLPPRLRLDTTRAIAAEKIRILGLFLASLDEEAAGALY
jgi:uncharacterized protein